MIIALHNEETRFLKRYVVLRDFLDSLGEPWELLLVDDGSSDGTYDRILELSASDPRVRAMGLRHNLGQGAAVKLGMLASRGETVLYTDADLPIPLSFLREIIRRVRTDCEVAVASRWMYGAKIGIPQPRLRRLLGRAYYKLIHSCLLDGVHDTNCGLKAYRGEAARLLFGFVRSWRWAFNVEHLWLARRMGYRICEIPAEWSHQEHSKVHVFRDGVFTAWELIGIKLRQWLGLYPLVRR